MEMEMESQVNSPPTDLPQVAPAATVAVRVDELLLLPSQPVGRLLHDPVLDARLVAPRRAQLEVAEGPHGQHDPDGQPEAEQDSDEGAEGQGDLWQ